MLVTKDLDNKVFDYIDTWGETLEYIIEWQVITAEKKRQLDIDNVKENAKRVTHDYTKGDRFNVEMTGIYRKLDYKKLGP